ncbi:hypothetical protein PanWU01x14_187970, partial [Parasponia andersonii]
MEIGWITSSLSLRMNQSNTCEKPNRMATTNDHDDLDADESYDSASRSVNLSDHRPQT